MCCDCHFKVCERAIPNACHYFNNAIVYGADQNQDWHLKDPLLYLSSTVSQLKPSTATHNNANELPMSGLSQNACKSATSEEKLRLP